jgi:hypothetical protein
MSEASFHALKPRELIEVKKIMVLLSSEERARGVQTVNSLLDLMSTA